MGYITKVQVIERANQTRQYYLICPAPLAQALELEKGEAIEWVVEDPRILMLRRAPPPKPARRGAPARAFWAFGGRWDLRRSAGRIRAVEGGAGRPAFDPHLLVSVWLYS